MAEGLYFISGADANTLCPTTQEICPARQNLVNLYSEHTDPQLADHFPPALHPDRDGIKLSIKLGEMSARTALVGCEGATEGVCPIREAMDESTSRRLAVGKFRTIRRLITGN